MSIRITKVVPIMFSFILIFILVPLVSASPAEQTTTESSLVQVARDEGRFATFIEALEATGLDERLEGEGPFTVFAPNDTAFASMPTAQLEGLFADMDALSSFLLYHVVEGGMMTDEITQADQLTTMTGQSLDVTTEGANFEINGVNVTNANIEGSNGIIHEIDAVLMAPNAGEVEETSGTSIPTGPQDTTIQETAVQTDTVGATEVQTGTLEATGVQTGTLEATGVQTGTVEATGVQTGTIQATGVQTGTLQPGAAGCQDYVVQAGDTLSLIAERFLGDINAYNQIADATNAAGAGYEPITDPNIIVVGQTICIPVGGVPPQAGTGVTTPGQDETAATGETGTEGVIDSTIPEGMSRVVFENLSSFDLIVDLTGPTRDTAIVPPAATQEFIIEPGQYSYNAHQPGGDFAVRPGVFELAVGNATRLVCFDSSTCEEQAATTQQPVQQPGETEGATPTDGTATPGGAATPGDATTTDETVPADDTATDDATTDDTTTDDTTTDDTTTDDTTTDDTTTDDATEDTTSGN